MPHNTILHLLNSIKKTIDSRKERLNIGVLQVQHKGCSRHRATQSPQAQVNHRHPGDTPPTWAAPPRARKCVALPPAKCTPTCEGKQQPKKRGYVQHQHQTTYLSLVCKVNICLLGKVNKSLNRQKNVKLAHKNDPCAHSE